MLLTKQVDSIGLKSPLLEKGSVSSNALIPLFQEWVAFMQFPKRLKCDEEGCFQGESWMDYLSKHNVQTTMAAGEAHFQNGVVERHIGNFRKTLENLRNDVGDKTLADNFQ
jgi:hypothetical protein